MFTRIAKSLLKNKTVKVDQLAKRVRTVDIPGPKLWDLCNLFRIGGSLHGKPLLEVQKVFLERYGKLCKLPGLFGKSDLVFVYDPKDIEAIYRADGPHPRRHLFDIVAYHRNEWRRDFYSGTKGLTISQGDEWWNLRSKMNPIMMKPNAMHRYIPKLDEIATDFLNTMAKQRNSNGELPKNFLKTMDKWALESIACITFDIRIGLLGENEDPNAQQFLDHVKLLFEHTYQLDVLPSLWKWYKTPLFNSAMRNLDDLIEESLHFLELGKAALKAKQSWTLGQSDEKGIFEQLLNINENVALVMSMDSIIAGVDTTMASTFNALYSLAMNPDKQQRLREELQQHFPDKNSKLTVDKIRDLPYLRACIKESARMTPILSNFRTASIDMQLQGYHVPKDTQFVFVQELLMKSGSNFENSEKFIPERFLRRAKTDTGCPQKSVNPFIYLPFGFGPRMCIGRRIAELEMEILIAKFIRRYEVSWNGPPPSYYISLANLPYGDSHFTIKDVMDN